MLDQFKRHILEDLNPKNATLKIDFLSFIDEKLEQEKQRNQRAQGTFSLPTQSQQTAIDHVLGILPSPQTTRPGLRRVDRLGTQPGPRGSS
jgi:hypothetical protein